MHAMPLLSSLPPLLQARIPVQGVRMLLHTVGGSFPPQLTYNIHAEVHLRCESRCSPVQALTTAVSFYAPCIPLTRRQNLHSFSHQRFLSEILGNFYLSFDGYRQGRTLKIEQVFHSMIGMELAPY